MIQTLKAMGLLRNLLQGTALVFILLIIFAQIPGDMWSDMAGYVPGQVSGGLPESRGLFFDSVLPAVTPLVFIVILLDMLMSQVWKAEADPAKITLLNKIIVTHSLINTLLLATWLWAYLPALARY